MLTYAGLFLLSAAALAFEVNLTRIFSVAQFYHFAFMVVSLALLGLGLFARLLLGCGLLSGFLLGATLGFLGLLPAPVGLGALL